MLYWTLWSSVLRKQLHCLRLGRYFLFADRQTDRQKDRQTDSSSNVLHKTIVECQNRQAHKTPRLPTSVCIGQFTSEMVDTTEMVRFRVRVQFLCMIEEGERERERSRAMCLLLLFWGHKIADFVEFG